MAESWVLSFCFFCRFFFWFLDFLFSVFYFDLFSHCRKTKQKLSMVAKQWENYRRCAVSVAEECSEKPHSQGVPFCKQKFSLCLNYHLLGVCICLFTLWSVLHDRLLSNFSWSVFHSIFPNVWLADIPWVKYLKVPKGLYIGVSQNGRSPKPLVSILNWSNDLDDLGYSHNF